MVFVQKSGRSKLIQVLPKLFQYGLVLSAVCVILQQQQNPPSFASSNTSSSSSLVASPRSPTQPADPSNCCSLAYKQSYGLFDDVSDLMWKRLKARTHSLSWYWNPKNPLENVEDMEMWNERNMMPDFQCPQIEKVGGKGHEGTKFICNPQRLTAATEPSSATTTTPYCLIYSIGCAGDYKFEDGIAAMHGMGCETHVFDPAEWTRKGDVEKKNIHYHAWGIHSTYNDAPSRVWPKGRGGGFKTLAETLRELGHENRTIDVLKIDCEGCEWSSHKDWIGLGIRQILVEMHSVPSPQGRPNDMFYRKPMNVTDYYQDFRDNGYAIFSKDPFKRGTELSFIKLHPDFWSSTT